MGTRESWDLRGLGLMVNLWMSIKYHLRSSDYTKSALILVTLPLFLKNMLKVLRKTFICLVS